MAKHKNLKFRLSAISLGLIAWLIYTELYLMGPQRTVPYNLSYAQLFLLKLTVTLPMLAIWLMAVYGVSRFRRYARLIQDSPDGGALLIVSNGLAIVVWGFIMQSLLGALVPFTVGGPWLAPVVFAQNQLPLLLTLIGFSVILFGARRLVKIVGLGLTLGYSSLLLLPYIVLGVIFSWFFYQNFQLQVNNGIPNFINGSAASLTTIAVPFVICWLIGILAIANIGEYSRHVPGAIYRGALRDLAGGISLTLLFSIVLQLLSLTGHYFKHFALGSVLVIVYLLLGLYALCFVFIMRGARKLTRIETTT